MTITEKYIDDFFLFLEAGFIAVNQADEDAAKKLFKAAELIKPENALIKVGMGYLHLHKLELTEAIKYFEEVLKMEPENEMAKAFLGIALSMTIENTAKGEKLLAETQKGSSDKQVQALCDTAIDFVDKFIKQAPGPAEVQKKEK